MKFFCFRNKTDGEKVIEQERQEKKQTLLPLLLTRLPGAVVNHTGSFLDTPRLAALTGTSRNYHKIFRENKTGELKKRALKQLLLQVVRGEQDQAEALIAVNRDLLLMTGTVSTYAQDLEGNAVQVKGTAFQLAIGAEDEEMAEMIAKYLDEQYPYVDDNNPGEKLKQYRAQFPAEEEQEERLRQQNDSEALKKLITAISHAPMNACRQVLDNEKNVGDDEDAKILLAALNVFRDYLKPKGIITQGKHFSMSLLVEAFQLYVQNYDPFGGWSSPKSYLYWRKVIGYVERFLPACYAQAFAQGVYHIVKNVEKCRRSFDYERGCFFPLDRNPNFRLGIDTVVFGRDEVIMFWCRWGFGIAILQNYIEQKQQRCQELCNLHAVSPQARI